MKTFKLLIVSILFITLTSCGGDDKREIALELTTENLSGTYSISSLTEDINRTTVSGSTTVNISTTTEVGDTFQVDFTLTQNGTYTALGQYRVTRTIQPNGGQPETESEILNVDSAGTYTINTSSGVRSINFVQTSGDFINGNYTVNLFNENSLALENQSSETNGQITTESAFLIGFSKQ